MFVPRSVRTWSAVRLFAKQNLFEIYEVCHVTECAREVFDWELSKLIYQDN